MSARLFLLAIALLSFCQISTAQYVQEWGDVAFEQWDINSFENDDDAHSIILFDVGESYVDRDVEIIYKRHKRIKILNPEQSDFAEIQISVYDDNSVQRLRSVSAHTINRGPDGELNTIKVDGDQIFTEDSGNWEVTSFTFPALEPGSIIEYRYEISYKNPAALPDWTFQHSSPILHSEYRVLVPDFLEYRSYRYGLLPYEQLSSDDNEDYMNEMRSYANLAPAMSDYKFYRTVLKNAPAIRSEPYVTSLINYKNHMKYQFSGYTNSDGFYESYMNTWKEISEELLDSDQFGNSITTRRSMRRSTEEIIEGIDDDLEKARAIYDYVTKKVQWNGNYSFTTTDRADDILEDLSGNSSDKAILLLSMLRSADLTADPVLISRRERGRVDWNYPTPNSFNHTLVLLQVGEGMILLDPIDEVIPFGMLNPSSINGTGFLITEDNSQIVDILPDNLSTIRTTTLLSIDEQGHVTAELRSDYYGYDAIIHRKLAEDEDELTYLEENHLENAPGSDILEHELLNLEDTSEPLIIKATVKSDQYATVAGDMIYINPFFKDRISENPFSNPDRDFRVELNFGTSKQYIATINIPQGYEIVEVPENRSSQFSEKAQFSFIQQVSNNIIQMRLGIVNNEIEVGTERYDELRSYYASLTEF
jgi:transglutaminase-like putative cysteine protease